MDLGIAGKTAVVGGSSQGMGLAIAEGLAREGCNVLLCARNEVALQAAQERLWRLAPRSGWRLSA